jgi:Fe-coproporphyrin III synthase
MSLLHSILPAPPTHLEHARISKLPILLLGIHDQCNCRCVMCDIWKRKTGLAFRASDLDRHRESIRKLGVKQVVLTGGEPLMNRELDAICQFFRELGVRITLLTTGRLLFQRAKTVATSIDDVIISIDGPADIHDRIRRVPGIFASIQKGVTAVRDHRPEMPVSCRTTVQKLNHASLRSTVDAAKSLRLNSISFLPADITSGAFNRRDGWTEERQSEVALTHEELRSLEDEIETLITTYEEDIRTGFIVENGTKLRRIADRFREYLYRLPPKAPRCNAPWVSAVVDVDGSVRPCFFHPVVSNVKQLTLQEAVNSETALSFRSTLHIANNSTCQRCVCSLNYRQ